MFTFMGHLSTNFNTWSLKTKTLWDKKIPPFYLLSHCKILFFTTTKKLEPGRAPNLTSGCNLGLWAKTSFALTKPFFMDTIFIPSFKKVKTSWIIDDLPESGTSINKWKEIQTHTKRRTGSACCFCYLTEFHEYKWNIFPKWCFTAYLVFSIAFLPWEAVHRITVSSRFRNCWNFTV